MVFEDTPVSSARRKDAGVFFLLAMQSRSLHPVDAVHGFGCFPTSILQSKMNSCIDSCPACAYSVKGFNLRNFRLREPVPILKISKSSSSFMPSVSKKTLKRAVIFVQNEMHAAKASCMQKRRSYLPGFLLPLLCIAGALCTKKFAAPLTERRTCSDRLRSAVLLRQRAGHRRLRASSSATSVQSGCSCRMEPGHSGVTGPDTTALTAFALARPLATTSTLRACMMVLMPMV